MWRNIHSKGKTNLGFDYCFNNDSKGKSGGLGLFWDSSTKFSIMSYSKGHIDTIISDVSKEWRFTRFYGNSRTEDQKDSWTILARLKILYHPPWIVGGDFNEIVFDDEKWGGNRRSED